MKRLFTLVFLFQISVAFSQRQEFQVGNTTQLVQFEKLLPSKEYNYRSSDLWVKWHLLILDLIEQTPGYTPNIAARTMAYINMAAYEACRPKLPQLNALQGQFQSYALDHELQIDSSNFSAEVAVNAAFYKSIDEFFVAAPYVWMERAQALRDSIYTKVETGLDLKTRIKSRNFGNSIAAAILKYASTDGGQQGLYRSYDLTYKLPACEACFEINRVADLENTGPLHPYWGQNRTFMKANQDSSVQVKPKNLFSKYPNSDFYKEALEVYKTSKEVVPGSEKHNIANFWDDAATYSYTATGHSMAILSQVLRTKTISIDSAAAVYLTLSTAINDAMIVAWRMKYKYNTIRPGAYIKRYIDSQWEPLILTPPFPEFPSGHSVQSACMATVLSHFFGEKRGFIDYSKFWVGAPRRFPDFWAAANETSISRLYGGIHFKDALTQGQELGKKVGKNALSLKTL
jgi:membrane-associated phospholipid phosphatase